MIYTIRKIILKHLFKNAEFTFQSNWYIVPDPLKFNLLNTSNFLVVSETKNKVTIEYKDKNFKNAAFKIKAAYMAELTKTEEEENGPGWLGSHDHWEGLRINSIHLEENKIILTGHFPNIFLLQITNPGYKMYCTTLDEQNYLMVSTHAIK